MDPTSTSGFWAFAVAIVTTLGTLAALWLTQRASRLAIGAAAVVGGMREKAEEDKAEIKQTIAVHGEKNEAKLEHITTLVNGTLHKALAQIEHLKILVSALIAANDAAQVSGRRQLRVLLVEDNANDAELISRACAGHTVTVAHNRKELEALLSGDAVFHAALIDYALPDLTWPAAMHLVRDKHPLIPVIVISGSIADGIGYKAMATEGASDYIPKSNLEPTVIDHILQREVALAVIRHSAQQKKPDADAQALAG